MPHESPKLEEPNCKINVQEIDHYKENVTWNANYAGERSSNLVKFLGHPHSQINQSDPSSGPEKNNDPKYKNLVCLQTIKLLKAL